MPTFFVPARSSRHRTACFALFRALVRQGRRVPLPPHVNTCAPDTRHVHPIQRFVRRAFRQNKEDTSPRLITAAFDAGHRMLKVLVEAQVAGSPAHGSIVAFLEKNKPLVHVTYRQWVARKKRERQQREQEALARGEAPRLPLLTRRPIPGTETTTKTSWGRVVTTYEYEYVPSQEPKPLSALSGRRRRVPRLVTEASGIPFLRLHKTQPRVLSQIIQHRRARRAKRTGLVSELLREGLDFAAQEDQWEDNLARAVAESGQKPIREPGTGSAGDNHNRKPVTYRQSVALSVAYLSAQLNVEAVDLLARSKAYLAIVDRERQLAEMEVKQRLEKERLESGSNDGKKDVDPR